MTEEEKQLKEFNEKWTMDKVVKNAIEQEMKNAHTHPAPETIKMFAKQGEEINEIKRILDKQDYVHSTLKTQIEEYIKSDNEFKEWMTPILKAMEKQQNFFSVGGTIAKGLILIGAVGTTFVGAVHFIKEWWNN